ncbi:MAG: hypothetical protein K2X93_27980 [Candidatus Obscuribacterales bacterium]|nr:hypothetical protein [Candidatus Obscuribacterales bacterium]
MKSKKLFSKLKQTAFLSGPLFVILALSTVSSLSAREQWQIERPDPPPTAPISTARYGMGQNQAQPAAGQVPGLSGSNSYQVPGLASGGWSGQPGIAPRGAVPGLAANGGWNGQPGGVPSLGSQIPGFDHSSQLPSMGQTAYGVNTPGSVPGLAGGAGALPPQGYSSGSQMPGFAGYPGPAPGQTGIPGLAQVPGLVSSGVTGAVPGVPPLPVQSGQGGVMPDYLKGILGQRLNAGTVLTGVAEADLSSKSSKRGDVFAIVLPHGFGDGNEMLVPPGSRILGVVVEAFAAKTQRVGMPGRLSISLKTLVFPDGRTTKINAMIDHNPAHDQGSEPKTRFSGLNAGDYGNAFKGMLYSSVSGISWVHNRQARGKEFLLKPGTPVSVKLNTSIDIAKMTNPAQAFQGTPGLAGVPTTPYPGTAVPGLSGIAPPGAIPGMPGTPQGYGAYGAPQPVTGQPMSSGQPYGTPQPVTGNGLPYGTSRPVSPGTFFPNDVQSPTQFQPGAQALSQDQQEDPNSIFKTPISSPGINTPEPF